MDLLQGATLGIAVLGAGLGVFNTVSAYRRGAVRWNIRAEVKPLKDGTLALFVEVVNTGRIAVAVEDVVLEWRTEGAVLTSYGLRDSAGYPRLPFALQGGRKLAIGPVGSYAIDAVAVYKPLTIVAKSEDGRRIKTRCVALRQLYQQSQAAAAES